MEMTYSGDEGIGRQFTQEMGGLTGEPWPVVPDQITLAEGLAQINSDLSQRIAVLEDRCGLTEIRLGEIERNPLVRLGLLLTRFWNWLNSPLWSR